MLVTTLGLQWGDEGKGKIVDYISRNADWIIRYAGGANAGHRLIVDKNEYSFHLIPSGILHSNTRVLLGSGMVIDSDVFRKELQQLKQSGISYENRIFISDRAHIVLPSHKDKDLKLEKKRAYKLGVTKKGIGSAYASKAQRTGIRVCDLGKDMHRFKGVLKRSDRIFLEHNAEFLSRYSINQFELLSELGSDEIVICEGAQGFMLDLDYGSYPYVTSGPTGLNGIAANCISPKQISEIIGIFKAYSTRVGEGPLFTEFKKDEKDTFEYYSEKGHEVGTTTGRLRRIGHLDLVVLKYAVVCTGATSLALTHLDVLDTQQAVKVCIGYECDGTMYSYLPSSYALQSKLKPVYKTLEGWQNPTEHVQKWDALPQKAKQFIHFVEDFLKVPIRLVSVGPERNQTIYRGPNEGST